MKTTEEIAEDTREWLNDGAEAASSFVLPKDATERKNIPIYSGFVKYFPRAIVAVAKLSAKGNIQHGIGDGKQPVWDRSKSPDELDSLMRHIIDEEWDAVAWRAMANLEKKLETQTKDT